MLKMAQLVVEVEGEALDGKGARLTLAQWPDLPSNPSARFLIGTNNNTTTQQQYSSS